MSVSKANQITSKFSIFPEWKKISWKYWKLRLIVLKLTPISVCQPESFNEQTSNKTFQEIVQYLTFANQPVKMLIQKNYKCAQSNAISTSVIQLSCIQYLHIRLQAARWQPVQSKNLQTTPTEYINRSFTTRTNNLAKISSAEAAAFFEQQSRHSSTADIIKVSSDIIVDMDEP